LKIQAIADTHGSYFIEQLEPCDLLLMAGDISPVRCDHSYQNQKQWFEDTFVPQLKEIQERGIAKYIVFIAGNHDHYLGEVNISDGNSRRINSLLPENVHYLCDELIEIEGLKVYGTPWCVLPKWARAGGAVWNFASGEDCLRDIYTQIPNGIDILVTHGPSHGLCDAILDFGVVHGPPFPKPEPLGSVALKLALEGLKEKPLYVFSGHIHSAERNPEKKDGVGYSCVSILNEKYSFCDDQKPFVFDLVCKDKR